MRTLLWLFFVILGFCLPVRSATSPPNIVFILADDLGWTDLACYGSKYYETPNIDRLAAQGLKFTSGHTCGPNCQPTRAALMTGQYGPRTGIYTVGSIDRFNWQSRPLRPVDNVTKLPLNKATVADALRKAGYVAVCSNTLRTTGSNLTTCATMSAKNKTSPPNSLSAPSNSIQNSSPGANRSTAQCLQRIPLLQKPIQKRNSQKIPTGIEDGSECVFV